MTRGAPETAPRFRVSLIGAPRIETPAGELPTSRPVVFAAALYLLLQGGRRVRRAELAALLWPDADDAARGERLRWLVAQLKGHGIEVPARAPEIVIAVGDAAVDVDELVASAAAAGPEVRVVGELLAGYEPDISDRFALWLEEMRGALEQRLRRWLLERLAEARRVGEWAVMEQLARRVLRTDPDNRDARTALAEAAAMHDAPAAAVARVAAHEESSAQAVLVGREVVLGQLLTALAPSGTTRRIVLAGPAGMGKSRLLDELVAAARGRGSQVACVRCGRGDGFRPLSVVIDLARALLELRGALGASPETLDVLRRFTGAVPRVDDATASEALRAAVFAALDDLLSAVAEDAPLLVAIDDAQWAEPDSWTLLAPMLGRHAGAQLVCVAAVRAARRADAAPLCERIFPEQGADAERDLLWLSPLDGASTAALMLARAAPRQIPGPVLERLVARAAGIPFVAQALADHWTETGDDSSLPSSVSRLVQARLARLSESAARALAAIAVLGQDAELPAVQAVATVDRATLLDATMELDQAGIARFADGIFTVHALWVESLSSRAPDSVLRLMHRYAAEWLEEMLPTWDSVVPRRLWAMAEHWVAAGDVERAQKAIDDAAELLAVSGFAKEAALMMERAAEAAGVTRVALQFFLKAGDLWLREIGTEVLVALPRILARHDQVLRRIDPEGFNPHHQLEQLAQVAATRRESGIERALEDAYACVFAEHASPSHKLSAAARAMRLLARWGDGERSTRVWNVIEGLDPVDDRDRINRALAGAIYFGMVGEDSARALRYIEPAVGLVRRGGVATLARYTSVMQVAAEIHEASGDLEHAQALRRETVQYGEKLRRPEIMHVGLEAYVLTALEAGRTDEAAEYLPLLGRPHHATDERLDLSRAIAWAIFALDRNDPSGARREFGADLSTVLDGGDSLARGRVLAIRLHIALLENDVKAVDDLLPRLLDCFEGRMSFMEHPAWVTAMCLERLEGREAAEAFVRRFIDEIRVERWTPRPELLRYLTSSSSP